MKISFKEWLVFIFIAVFSFGLWYKLSYPQYKFINLEVDRKQAINKSLSYLQSLGVNPQKYRKAAVFVSDDWPDRYLQKTIGIEKEEEFLAQNAYELFSWQVRFFQELKKEEYIVWVSAKSAEVLSFKHLIEDIEPRHTLDKETARKRAEEFLKKTYALNFQEYDFHEEKIKHYDNRTDYNFSWEKKGIYVPWKKGEGGAKLLVGATISGEEVRSFYKSDLDIPEKFQRYIEKELLSGEYLSNFSFIFSLLFLGWSVYILVRKKNAWTGRFIKKWFIYLTGFLAAINILSIFNNLQMIIIDYPTSSGMGSFLGIYSIRAIISVILFSVAFILPGLAGESLRQEELPQNKYSSFLHYLKSTFYSRQVSASIIFGYLLFIVLLGFQATIFYFGQKYLGVWKEWMRLSQFSSAYLPFLGAFITGITASFREEVIFRIFGISWAKKYFKRITLAVFFSALVWGTGHSFYAIFPTWFRAIEVSIIGLFFGFIFLRYGIIPLIVAHYLFNVFWDAAAYLLGQGRPFSFFSSLFVLILPLILAVVIYFINKDDKERELKMLLNSIEEYNLGILIIFIREKQASGFSTEKIKQELLSHNWDNLLVELALKETSARG